MKALITLFGKDNSGKTTALRDVVKILTGILPPKSGDFRIAFEWKGKIIFLSTYGDDDDAIKKNIYFFSCAINCSFSFYAIHNGVLEKCCHRAEKNQYLSNHQPDICISASRNGESTLGLLREFAQKNTQLGANVAIQKAKTQKGYNNVVQPIIDLIDKLK